MKKDPQIYLIHIRDAIACIREYTAEGEDVFLRIGKPRMLSSAILKSLVKRLPVELKSKYESVPWKDVAGMRDRLIHHYFGVNLKMVWGVVANRLADLEAVIQKELNLML